MGKAQFALWGVAATLYAAPLWAQQTEDQLLNACYQADRAGRNEEALTRCQEAVRQSRTGRALAMLGMTEFHQQRWVDAANHIEEALLDREHPRVRAQSQVLEAAMVQIRPHVASLRFETSEQGTTVSIAGAEPLALPHSTPVYVAPGQVEIVARAHGAEVRRAMTLSPGQAARVPLEFPSAPVTPVVTAAAPAVTQPMTREVAPPIVPPERDAPRGSSLPRTLGWVAAGGALIGLGLGVVAWRLREGEVSDYNARCLMNETNDTTITNCIHDQPNTQSAVDTWTAVETAGFVAGGLLAVGSAVLFITAPSSSATARTALRCGGGPGTVGVQCGMAF